MLDSAHLILLAAISGCCFAFVVLGMRMGADRGLLPQHLVLVSACMGTIFFAWRWWSAGAHVSGLVLIPGVLAGVTQYAILHLIRPALALGPVSPLACAAMLGFVPVIVYSRIAFGEQLTMSQQLAVLFAIACVIAGAANQRRDQPVSHHLPRSPLRRLEYGIILLLILVINSIANMGLKYVGLIPPPNPESVGGGYLSFYLLLLYIGLGLGVLLDLVISRRRPPSWTGMLWVGSVVGAGSVGGMWLLSLCMELPAAVAFTVSNIVALVFTAIVAALLMREERTLAWYLTVSLGIVVIVLSSWSGLQPVLAGLLTG